MLINLLKYEIRATMRLLLPLYLVLLIFAGINRLLFSLSLDVSTDSFLHSISIIISMVIYITLMIGIIVMTLVILIQRFYKNLLGDEGYLMFTLPVQTWKHILSKLLIALLWIISSGMVAVISILIISNEKFELKEIPMIFDAIGREVGVNGYLFSFEMLFLGMIGFATNIVLIYAAIALGHLFNKYKLLASFGMYIALSAICQVLVVLYVYLLKDSIPVFSSNVPTNYEIQILLLYSFIITAIIAAGSFILTQSLLKKKLNLE